MKYKIITNVNFIYSVEAKNEEEARDKVLSGSIEAIEQEVLTDEILKE